jgi:hypothetical protein
MGVCKAADWQRFAVSVALAIAEAEQRQAMDPRSFTASILTVSCSISFDLATSKKLRMLPARDATEACAHFSGISFRRDFL